MGIGDRIVYVTDFPITRVDGKYYNIFHGFVENKIIINVGDVSQIEEYRLEYRFCSKTELVNDQNATNLLPNSEFEYYPNSDNDVEIDVSLISDLFIPNIVQTQIMSSLQKTFQVQYREKYYENGADVIGNWVTAYSDELPAFVAFVLIHSGGDVAKYNYYYQILNDTKRLYKNYTNNILLLSSLANKIGNITLKLKYYKKDLSLSGESNVIFTAIDGLYSIPLEAYRLNSEENRYLVIQEGETILSRHTLYDTTSDESEYFLRWIGNDGDIKSWLFTKTTKFKVSTTFVFNKRDFRGIPSYNEELYILSSDGLSKEEYNYIKDIIESNFITLTNLGLTYNCILNTKTIEGENYSNTKSITIEIIKKEKYLMNV